MTVAPRTRTLVRKNEGITMYGKMTAAALGAAMVAVPANASVYSDDLGKCLVAKTTEADRAMLVRWIFAAVSANPVVQSVASVTPKQRDAAAKEASTLIQRLVTADCRPAAVTALKYDGAEAISNSFRLLGEVAMRGLMSAPPVAAELAKLDANADPKAWEALAKEAGVAVPKAR